MRVFRILIKSPNRKHILSLPCTGDYPYDGCDALEVMRSYAKRRPGVAVAAHTVANKIEEQLTLAEMEVLFGEETNARKPWEKRIQFA